MIQSVMQTSNLLTQGMIPTDAAAQLRLGLNIYSGDGASRDRVAFDLFHMSAEQGNPRAMSCLAACYYAGDGTPRKETEALAWFGKAAACGDPAAIDWWGDCFAIGHHAPQSETKALKFYRIAADKGYRPSNQKLETLRRVCSTPSGGMVDTFVSLSHAVLRGDVSALVGRCLLAQKMTEKQLVQAEGKALRSLAAT